MNAALVLVVGLLLGVGVFFYTRMRARKRAALEERLADFGTLTRPPTLEEIELAQPFSERILRPALVKMAEFASRFTPEQTRESAQHKLALAGNPYGWGATEFLGFRAMAFLLMGGLGAVLYFVGQGDLQQRLLMLGGLVGMGLFLPTMWLSSKTRGRQKSIVKSLPDALDLLTICVEAGLGFDAALAKVAEKWEDDLSLAFRRVLQEIQLGKLRRDALREMADNMEVPDVSTFVAAIIQADQLGVSIARVLRIQSDQMRMRRRQRAEEQARASQMKVLLPVVFFIFPAILIVLLGPAIIKIKNMPGIFNF